MNNAFDITRLQANRLRIYLLHLTFIYIILDDESPDNQSNDSDDGMLCVHTFFVTSILYISI